MGQLDNVKIQAPHPQKIIMKFQEVGIFLIDVLTKSL